MLAYLGEYQSVEMPCKEKKKKRLTYTLIYKGPEKVYGKETCLFYLIKVRISQTYLTTELLFTLGYKNCWM